MATNKSETPEPESGTEHFEEPDTLTATRPIRALANKMHLTVNELIIAAGLVKIVRNRHIPDTPATDTKSSALADNPEIVFDELNQDEFMMRYADDG